MSSKFLDKLKRNNSWDDEEASPMWGVSNMSDVMLVLAVGIMLALVANWNLDVSTGKPREVDINTEAMQEIDEYESIDDSEFIEKISQNGMEEIGSIYVDKNTGKMYVIVSEEDETN